MTQHIHICRSKVIPIFYGFLNWLWMLTLYIFFYIKGPPTPFNIDQYTGNYWMDAKCIHGPGGPLRAVGPRPKGPRGLTLTTILGWAAGLSSVPSSNTTLLNCSLGVITR